jgi:hypothetical protein
VKIKAPPGWDVEIWREARETGLECLLVHDDPDFELVIESRTYDKGVRSTGADKELLQIMHRECIRGLTEPNPEWTEKWSEKPMFKKPKDMGHAVTPGHITTTICLGDLKEAQRLERRRSNLVRSIIHAFVSISLLRNKLS